MTQEVLRLEVFSWKPGELRKRRMDFRNEIRSSGYPVERSTSRTISQRYISNWAISQWNISDWATSSVKTASTVRVAAIQTSWIQTGWQLRLVDCYLYKVYYRSDLRRSSSTLSLAKFKIQEFKVAWIRSEFNSDWGECSPVDLSGGSLPSSWRDRSLRTFQRFEKPVLIF